MALAILVAEPNPGFAAMIQQSLDATRRYKVALTDSGAEAVSAASRAPYDLAIVDTSINDIALPDVVRGLRAARPTLPVIVILPYGQASLKDAAIDVQGTLSKPFYLPDLEAKINAALAIPPRAHTPTPPPFHTDTLSEAEVPTPSQATSPAPSWLADVNHAAQYLTTLTLEASAEAALLMRGEQLVAYAGQFGREQAEELARIVADNWAKDGGGGHGAQARFIRLSNGADYLVYSTLAADDIVLSMAFQAETPLGMIRKQAKKATDALFQPSASESSAPPVVETIETEPPQTIAVPELPNEWPSRGERDEAPVATPSLPLAHTPASSPAPALEPPPFPEVRRTPHGLYALSYTFLLVPRLPHTRLIGGLKEQLEVWTAQLALVRDWHVTSLMIQPDHVAISLDCSPSEAPERVVKTLMQFTAEKIMADFPHIAAEHGRRPNSFWAPGYYVVTPGRRLSAEEITRFIEYERKEQGIA